VGVLRGGGPKKAEASHNGGGEIRKSRVERKRNFNLIERVYQKTENEGDESCPLIKGHFEERERRVGGRIKRKESPGKDGPWKKREKIRWGVCSGGGIGLPLQPSRSETRTAGRDLGIVSLGSMEKERHGEKINELEGKPGMVSTKIIIYHLKTKSCYRRERSDFLWSF